jgi:stage III sporulation protein AG
VDFKKILEELNKLKNIKNISNLIIVFLVGVLILIVTSFFNDGSGKAAVGTMNGQKSAEGMLQEEFRSYEQTQEIKLKRLLGQMQGVGRVDLTIHFEAGEELVPAVNINDGNSSIKERDNQGGERETKQTNNGSTVVITSKGNETAPLILKKYYPKVTGVMIVAEGAEDKQIQLNIINSVSRLFNISSHQVIVSPMRK